MNSFNPTALPFTNFENAVLSLMTEQQRFKLATRAAHQNGNSREKVEAILGRELTQEQYCQVFILRGCEKIISNHMFKFLLSSPNKKSLKVHIPSRTMDIFGKDTPIFLY